MITLIWIVAIICATGAAYELIKGYGAYLIAKDEETVAREVVKYERY